MQTPPSHRGPFTPLLVQLLCRFANLPLTRCCLSTRLLGDRVIDVGSEWRTFSNEKALKDPSRVGDAQNPLLNGGDLTTMIGKVGGCRDNRRLAPCSELL